MPAGSFEGFHVFSFMHVYIIHNCHYKFAFMTIPSLHLSPCSIALSATSRLVQVYA